MSWIKKEALRTKVVAQDWQEAVRAAGDLLVENHYVEERYIDGMIRTVEELGPYIVIAPAYCHAPCPSGTRSDRIWIFDNYVG